MKTSELTGAALDWAVAMCEGATDIWQAPNGEWCIEINGQNKYFDEHEYSTDWATGGPLIEREEIMVYKRDDRPWTSTAYRYGVKKKLHGKTKCTIFYGDGPTPLISAMRCYVASKLGDTVDVPEELQ